MVLGREGEQGGRVARFAAYSRREMRRGRRAWLRRNWTRVVGATAILAVTGALVTASVAATVQSPTARWYSLGVLHAVLVTSYLWILNTAVLASDQQAIWHLRGAWGEENTRDELKRAKRRRVIWDWVDSINLQAGDLDHVVVTRRGGIVVLDSKWRNQSSDVDRAAMVRSAQRARQRCEGVTRSLLGGERRSRHRARSSPVAVRAAVVVWGSLQAEIPEGAQIDGVDFVTGHRLLSWLRALDGEPVAKPAAKDISHRLREYRAGTWERTKAGRQRLVAPTD